MTNPPSPNRGTAPTTALSLDTEARLVRLRSRLIPLGPREFSVLEVMVAAAGRVVSIDEIAATIFDGNLAGAGRVRSVIGRLRRKLGDSQVIETIVGEGYRVVT